MLYDAYNRPISLPELTSEQAGPVSWMRTRTFESVASGLSPDRLAQVLRSAQEGEIRDYLTLAFDMEEREPHYGAVLSTRKQAVAGLELQVKSASDSKEDVKIADAVRSLLTNDSGGDLVNDLLDALGKGFSVCEIEWLKESRQWWPNRFIWRDPRWFTFQRETDELMLRTGAALEGEPLMPAKFIVHFPRLRTGLRIGGGLARLACVSFLCKNYTLKDWMAFMETYGHPLRVGRYGPGATDKDVAILRRAVLSLGVDAAAVLPDSMRIEFQQPPNTTGGDRLFEGFANWIDRQVSKAVLGQTMTTDDGSSKAQATVHNEVRQDIVRSDTRCLCATLNRELVKPFVDLNFGPRERGQYPQIYYPFSSGVDLSTLADALAKLVPLGLRVEQSVIRDRLGLPDPGDEADVLERAPAIQPGSAPALNGAGTPTDPVTLADQIAADALEDWEPVAQGLTDPILRAAEESSSYEDFVTRLAQLAEDTPPAQLVQSLAAAAWKSRGVGDAS